MMEKKSFEMGKTAQLRKRAGAAGLDKASRAHSPGETPERSIFRSLLWSRHLPWGLLVFGLIVTAAVTWYMKTVVKKAEMREFSSHCEELHIIISERLADHARILMGSVALFNASDSVTREEWRIFSQSQKLEKLLPGIQGVGFALLLRSPELSKHIQEIRSEGFPDYEVKPEGDREIYTSIIYLEPFSGRNLRAFGYDMFAEPVRRVAMERARDTDSPALSGKVILVQETDSDLQAGTLMYVPVYRKGMPTDSVEQRRAAIYGWVYSPYRMEDLMQGTLAIVNRDKKNINIKIYDGDEPSPRNLLYENPQTNGGRNLSAADFSLQKSVDFNGRRWTLLFTKTADGFLAAEYLKVWLTMFGGLLITLLLFLLVRVLLNIPVEAQKIAEKLTVDLHEKTALLSGLLLSIPDIVFFKRRDGVYLGCNPEFARLVDRNESEIVGFTDYDLFGKETADFFLEQDRIMLEQGKPRHNEETIRYPDGEYATIDTFKAPLRDVDGRVIGILGVSRNITERKWANKRVQDALLYARNLIEASIDPMATISLDGKITDINIATEKITGLSREKLIGTDFADYFTDPEQARAGYRKAFEQGQVIDYPLSLRHVSGKVTEVLYNASVYRDEKGEVIGVFASARDITERKLAEEALREKTALLEAQSNATIDGILVVDNNKKRIFANQRIMELFNVPSHIVDDNDDAALLKRVVSLAKHPVQFLEKVEYLYARPGEISHDEIELNNGIVLDRYSGPVLGEDGKNYGRIWSFRDITERKKSERSLEEVSDRLALAVRAGGVGIWDWDVVNDRLIWDEQMYRLYGIRSDEFSGAYEAWKAGLHPEDLERGDTEIQNALSGKKDFDIEFRVLWPDGTVRNIRAYAIVQRDASGRPLRMIGTNWDVTEQKRLEEKIKSSEKNFRTFFQSADDIIVVGSVDGRILFANEAFTRKLGYAKEDLENFRILDMHPEEKRKEAEEIFGAMMRGERDFCPLPLQMKTGRYLPVETRIWFGKWNDEDCIFGVSKDLSLQQAALEKFEKFFRSNPALLAISSTIDGRFIDVNDAFLKRLGFTRDEVIGRTSGELNLFVEPELQREIACNLESQGRVSSVELKVRDKGGAIVDGLFSGEIIDNQGEKVFLTVMADLTDLKKAEASLIRTVEMKKLLMELSSRYINIPLNEVDSAIREALGKMGKFVSSDRAYVFSYDFEGKTMSNDYEWCDVDIEPQIDKLKEVPIELVPDWISVHRKGESVLIGDVSALPQNELRGILEQQGIKSLLAVPMMLGSECIGFVGFDSVKGRYSYTDKEIALLSLFSQMLVNVKSRVKVEKRLLEANSLLEATSARANELAEQATIASTAKSRFLAHMSHEIRTPLNAILGFSQLMQYDLELSPSQKQRVDTINRSGKHLLSLLNDILELSKIEAGNLSVTYAPFDLHSTLNDTVMLFRSRAEEKNLTLSIYGLKKSPNFLVSDEQKLRQVIVNLLSNAVKYTMTGGVSLRVNVEEGGPDGMRLTVLVEDTGPGMTAEEMEQLFLPFEQTSTGRNSGTGTGLGLAISRQFARVMGGDLTASSELKKGSVFRFCVPVKIGAVPGDSENRPVLRLEEGQPGFRILVAEDDNDSRSFLVQMLGNIGFEVLQVNDGKQAVAAFISGKPQLILMDDSMPVMRGDEAVRLIRKSPGGASVKIIVLTANASDETRQRFISSGADEFMSKPFSQCDLFEKIRILSGIRYVYADSSSPQDPITQGGATVLSKEKTGSLPVELREQIRAATISCRHDQLLKLIQQVTAVDPDTGKTLRDMALRFDYNALIKLFK